MGVATATPANLRSLRRSSFITAASDRRLSTPLECRHVPAAGIPRCRQIRIARACPMAAHQYKLTPTVGVPGSQGFPDLAHGRTRDGRRAVRLTEVKRPETAGYAGLARSVFTPKSPASL